MLEFRDIENGQEFMMRRILSVGNNVRLTVVFRGFDVIVFRTDDGSEFASTEREYNRLAAIGELEII